MTEDSPLSSGESWRSRYIKRLAIIDAVVVLWAASGALVGRFGELDGKAILNDAGLPYVWVTVGLALGWWAMLGLWGSRDETVIGHGNEEYKRIISASFWLFGLIAIVSYSLQLETARGYIGIAMPAGTISLVLARILVRRLLHTERAAGGSMSRVLLVGGTHSVEHLTRSLRSQPMAGYLPVATYLPGAPIGTTIDVSPSLPTVGYADSEEDIMKAVREVGPDAVAFSSGVPLPPSTIRKLGWALADLQIKMIMAPALTDIAGPRIRTQPLAGLPLIHVSTPNLNSRQKLFKRVFDIVGASLLILILSPVLLFVGILVRSNSPGPILFRQDRVGVHGKHFVMLKYRSMIVDAEAHLASLEHQSEGNSVMFKLRADPRVTSIGKILRRYSLDELPQLFNVITGKMSLVGPRPPLPSEVAKYSDQAHRRLLVRPGLTGLWQVSGRSLLSWDDTVRLDLYYVENWSLTGDIAILLKTVRAVLARQGAY